MAATLASAQMSEIQVGLFTLAAALAVLMIAIQGVRWVIADEPKHRAEAKQGLVWTIIGLIVAYLSVTIVYGLYCSLLPSLYGASC